MSLICRYQFNGDLNPHPLSDVGLLVSYGNEVYDNSRYGLGVVTSETDNYSLRELPVLDEFSISFYMKNTDETGRTSFIVVPSTQGSDNFIRTYNNRIQLTVVEVADLSSYSISSDVLTSDVWYHVGVTVSRLTNTIALYINGVKQGERVLDVVPSQWGGASWRIAARTGNNDHFDGCLSDFRVYDHVLSAVDFKELSQQLIFHMTFENEGSHDESDLIHKMNESDITIESGGIRGTNCFRRTRENENNTFLEFVPPRYEITISWWDKFGIDSDTDHDYPVLESTDSSNWGSGASGGFVVGYGWHSRSINCGFAGQKFDGFSISSLRDSTEWNHVAVTYNSSTGTRNIYVNGELVDSLTGDALEIEDTGVGLSLGRDRQRLGIYVGYLDDVRVYATELSSTDIKSLYQTSTRIANDTFYTNISEDVAYVDGFDDVVVDYNQYRQIAQNANTLIDLSRYVEGTRFKDNAWIRVRYTTDNLFIHPSTIEISNGDNVSATGSGFLIKPDLTEQLKGVAGDLTLEFQINDVCDYLLEDEIDYSNLTRLELYASNVDTLESGETYSMSITFEFFLKENEVTRNGLSSEANEVAYSPTLVDYRYWTVGESSSVGNPIDERGRMVNFSPNGGSGDNRIVIDTNPNGELDIMWKGFSSTDESGADGGFNPYSSNYIPIDSSKNYRYTIWMKRSSLPYGTMYFGLYIADENHTRQSPERYYYTGVFAESPTDNAYFFSTSGFRDDEWTCFVFYLFAHDATQTEIDEMLGKCGAYRDGVIISDTMSRYCYQMHEDTAEITMRAYNYYSTYAGEDQHILFYRPTIEELDGSELPLDVILNCEHHPSMLKYKSPDDIDNAYMIDGISVGDFIES